MTRIRNTAINSCFLTWLTSSGAYYRRLLSAPALLFKQNAKVISISLVKHCFSSPFVFLFYPSAFLQMAQSRNFLTDLRFGNSLEYFIIINVQTEDCWNIIFSVFDGNIRIFKIELCRNGNSMFRIENSVFCSTKSNEVQVKYQFKLKLKSQKIL